MMKVIAARLADAKEPPGRPERQPESPLLLGFRVPSPGPSQAFAAKTIRRKARS